MEKERTHAKRRSELELLDEWYTYNSYVRKRYLRVLAKLPEAELSRDRGASFPSLLDIATHILDAYRWWFLYVYHDRVHQRKRLRGSGLDLRGVRREERKIDSYVRKFLQRLSPSDLEKVVVWHDATRTGKRSKKTNRVSVGVMLWHMVEEELQHRGELNALLWQIDRDPPITGWDPWDPGEKNPSAQAFWEKWRKSNSKSQSDSDK